MYHDAVWESHADLFCFWLIFLVTSAKQAVQITELLAAANNLVCVRQQSLNVWRNLEQESHLNVSTKSRCGVVFFAREVVVPGGNGFLFTISQRASNSWQYNADVRRDICHSVFLVMANNKTWRLREVIYWSCCANDDVINNDFQCVYSLLTTSCPTE